MRKWLIACAAAALAATGMTYALHSNKVDVKAVTEHDFGGGYLIWTIEDYPARALHDNSFRLVATGYDGAPLTGAVMSINLEMMNMVCGDMSFELQEEEPGVYRGVGVPLMPGTWKAELEVERSGVKHAANRLLKAVH